MEYDDNSHIPIEGAFYSTTSYNKIKFNYFREEEKFNLSKIGDHDYKFSNIIYNWIS